MCVVDRRRLVWLHLPLTLWGVLAATTGVVCPLTPLENTLRQHAGQRGYAGGFLEHYLTAALYPEGLTHKRELEQEQRNARWVQQAG